MTKTFSARLRARHRDERGAYAVMFALVSVVLFGISALSVDLGNMYQRKAETQSQADLAALAGAPALATSQAAARIQVAAYLNLNRKQGQQVVSAAMLADGELNNGEVTFPSRYSMRVTTPAARVQFGLAAPLTQVQSSNVNASATVGIGTPGSDKVLPFYAVTGSGCDYGSQALSDPANGHTQSIVPTLVAPLTNPSPTSNSSLTSVIPWQFAVGATGQTTVISGAQLSGVTRIGFFREPTESPNAFEEVIPSNGSASTISNVPVPTNVTDYPGVWWVRVFRSGSNTGWSSVATALPIRVGDGPIDCPSIANAGNFGSLKLARTSNPSSWIPDNIAKGLQLPLTLGVQVNPASLPLCTPGGPNVVYTATTGSPTLYPNTNCVDTDTGLTAQTATQGLITGTSSGYAGRLVVPTTTSVPGRNCGVGHNTTERSMLGYALNDDTLTCFMNDPSMKLSAIASPSYSGGAVLSPKIYESPRFCYVPVLATEPTTGGSQHYSIVDMRPCFITSESNNSSYNTQLFTDGTISTTGNGLTIPVNKVTTMRVYFFNKRALPAEGPAQPGVILDPNGPLVTVLTD
jgi:Flp pilus assembly protein TadG